MSRPHARSSEVLSQEIEWLLPLKRIEPFPQFLRTPPVRVEKRESPFLFTVFYFAREGAAGHTSTKSSACLFLPAFPLVMLMEWLRWRDLSCSSLFRLYAVFAFSSLCHILHHPAAQRLLVPVEAPRRFCSLSSGLVQAPSAFPFK